MTGFFKRSAMAAALAVACAASAQAATTTLTFSELIGVHSSLNYSGTAGGSLTVAPSSGSLVILAGELGTAKWTNWDPRIGSGESITFTFQNDVKLSYWDLDDLFLSTNKFSLKVDGGAAQTLSLFSHGTTPALVGKSFTFGYKGDSYFIDTLKFSSVTPAVPEPAAGALILSGLAVAGVIARRRNKAA